MYVPLKISFLQIVLCYVVFNKIDMPSKHGLLHLGT